MFGFVLFATGCGNTHDVKDPSGVELVRARSGLLGTSVVSESNQYASDYQYCLLRQNGRSDAAEQCRHMGNIHNPGPRCIMVWQGWMMYESCPGRPLTQVSPAPYSMYGYGNYFYQSRLR
ncbi:hypothetical protein IT408_03585 [Candidatus Uhrbacteria bacterium]|nr:hypothetical protein [Candidatus Uhrbacteria bacterium]